MVDEECLEIFGRQPENNYHTGGKLHLSWIEQCRDFERLDTDESIKRSLCRASRYNYKEMEGPQTLLLVWAWEQMPYIAPIRADYPVIEIPLAHRWSRWQRRGEYRERSVATFRCMLDDMLVDGVYMRPYNEFSILDDLVGHLPLCLTACCLVTFECVEWHAADRVERQQSVPQSPFLLGHSHCQRLSGHQFHDWRNKNDHWVMMWDQKR
ncbi:hypothetical protein PIB30_094216 [Stylosanthes scabra]|uniref:Aminotransferase-like plant mobile domain-containing protein n=1 Tax=Stylosanthes scabra TaxID=79078 RepID=A0ABU6SWP6_9FABA|nr:hypothetical protein [Stylosanthes scabra]